MSVSLLLLNLPPLKFPYGVKFSLRFSLKFAEVFIVEVWINVTKSGGV